MDSNPCKCSCSLQHPGANVPAATAWATNVETAQDGRTVARPPWAKELQLVCTVLEGCVTSFCSPNGARRNACRNACRNAFVQLDMFRRARGGTACDYRHAKQRAASWLVQCRLMPIDAETHHALVYVIKRRSFVAKSITVSVQRCRPLVSSPGSKSPLTRLVHTV